MHDNLFDPILVGHNQLKNRIVLAPMTRGRASHSDFHSGALPVSASAVKLNGDQIHTPQGSKPYETPRALTVTEIKAIVEDYKNAALNAKKAGFSGVEVHAANGHLINQFLDSKTNLREDEYGGSIENRYWFLQEVLGAVLGVFAPDSFFINLTYYQVRSQPPF